MESNGLSSVLLILDQARCHLTAKVKARCEELHIKCLYIPPRLTGLLQPADVCWFSVLKKHYHRLWNDWFINADKSYTRNDNARSPGYVQCIQWLSKMWIEFEESHIIKSFECCGILHQFNLHSNLRTMLHNNIVYSDYIDELQDEDAIDGFEGNEQMFDQLDEVIHELEVFLSCVSI
jgi:hypothetical protein